MQPFIEYVVKGLVQFPDQVSVTPTERNGVTVYELRVESSDIGKVVGRSGRTINAIRSLLIAGSGKKGIRCSLELIDDEGGRRDQGYDDQGDRGRGPDQDRGRGRGRGDRGR